MNEIVSKDDISRVIMNMDRKKREEEYAVTADISSRAASAIGTSTPTTLLTDIRQSIGELATVVKMQHDAMMQQMQEQQRMHVETIAYIQQLTDTIAKMSTYAPVHSSQRDVHQLTESQARQDYYHSKDKISTSAHIFACIFIHLERMVSRSTSYQVSMELDTTIMELKDWANVVKAVSNVDNNQTAIQGKLELPKPTSEECRYVLSVLASTIPGRGISSKPEHFSDMAARCPAVMSCTEEIRRRILKCPGLLGQQKSKAIMSIEYPYVKNGTILLTNKAVKPLGSTYVFDSVLKLASRQKDLYVAYVLRDGEIPINAVKLVADK